MEEKICPHCGQLLMAGKLCDCEMAKRERRIKAQIAQTEEAILEIFGEQEGKASVSSESIEILKEVAEQIIRYKMHSATITLLSGTKAKLSRVSKGIIKIERTEVKKESAEVEE